MIRRSITRRRWAVSGVLVGILGLMAIACGEPPSTTEPTAEVGGVNEEASRMTIDQRSYDLGVIGAFSEVVSYGIKRLALSAAMSPDRMSALIDEALAIADRHGVSTYLEKDFLVTDLFPPEVTEGKHVLLIYTGATGDEYQALKAQQATLLAEGRYEGEARAEVARAMGRLLSYPEPTIDRMLSEVTP